MATASLSPPLAAPPLSIPPAAYPIDATLADLQRRLGGVPLERIRLYPWPGLACENDVLEVHAQTGRLCELIDGILVEKPMGFYESAVAVVISRFIGNYLEGRKLGIVGGADGMLKILRGRIRIPDVSFISWDRLPRGRDPVPAVSPDLAVEVLSEGNTEQEMQDKLAEYFAGGTRVAWIIDPFARTARIYHAPDQITPIDETGSLTAGDVLPDFRLSLKDLFAELDRPENSQLA
jgi:Uma2 family endonuclease